MYREPSGSGAASSWPASAAAIVIIIIRGGRRPMGGRHGAVGKHKRSPSGAWHLFWVCKEPKME
jgi:hypothetical protein